MWRASDQTLFLSACIRKFKDFTYGICSSCLYSCDCLFFTTGLSVFQMRGFTRVEEEMRKKKQEYQIYCFHLAVCHLWRTSAHSVSNSNWTSSQFFKTFRCVVDTRLIPVPPSGFQANYINGWKRRFVACQLLVFLKIRLFYISPGRSVLGAINYTFLFNLWQLWLPGWNFTEYHAALSTARSRLSLVAGPGAGYWFSWYICLTIGDETLCTFILPLWLMYILHLLNFAMGFSSQHTGFWIDEARRSLD